MTTAPVDADVAVVGGGPSGASAAVFCARAGLETVVFDRGPSSIQHCAHLENYPGFPGGIDVATFCTLLHEHVEAAGCDLRLDLVDSVDPLSDRDGFSIHTQDDATVTTRRVVAATRYDGEYLRGLDDESIFETVERHGEETEVVDRDYAALDGATSIDGLYVASPSDGADRQAVIAAGRGARVGRRVVADARRDRGWWDAVAERRDWLRRADDVDDRWTDREHLEAWFDERHGADAPVDVDSERYRRVRTEFVEDRLARSAADEERERRAAAGHRSLAAHLDPEAVVDALDERDLLDAMDDAAIDDYVETRDSARVRGSATRGSEVR